MQTFVVAWVAGFAWMTPPPATQPTDRAVSQPTTRPSQAATESQIDSILERMEAMGDTVDDLRCQVEYAVEDLIGLSEFTKFGRIVYKRTQPNPTFFITFRKMHEGGIVVRKKEWYLFKNRWLYEAKEAGRTIIKREVIREGQTVDLFSLEKAPFPIPFGQRKDEILRHFRVTLMPPGKDDPTDTDHLICVPRPGSRLAEDYSRLEFFVSRALRLPTKIIAFEADADGQPSKIITAVFPDLTEKSINAGLTAKAFTLPPETKKYQQITEPLEEPATPTPRHD